MNKYSTMKQFWEKVNKIKCLYLIPNYCRSRWHTLWLFAVPKTRRKLTFAFRCLVSAKFVNLTLLIHLVNNSQIHYHHLHNSTSSFPLLVPLSGSASPALSVGRASCPILLLRFLRVLRRVLCSHFYKIS